MKNIFKYSISLLMVVTILFGCTDQFEEFKADNDALTAEDVSARFFFPPVQYKLWMTKTWDYFYTVSQYSPAYGGYASFGHKSSWEMPDVVFNTNRSWGAASNAWNVWSAYFLTIDGFQRLVKPGSDLENELMYAVGDIMKSTYFATYSELFGEIPYSEVGTEGILTPKFDEQKDIYKGIIDALDLAMSTIGDNTTSGIGANDLAEYDLLFGGDLQMWKAFANSLKLRIALRAKGAPEEDFADAAITSALAQPLLSADAKIKKDLTISNNISSTDGYFTRYGLSAMTRLSDKFVNLLNETNDPRISAYAEPIEAAGQEVVFGNYTEASNKEKVDYLLTNTLDVVGVPYTSVQDGADLKISIATGEYYVGQPMRFVDGMKTFLDPGLFSGVDELIIGSQTLGEEMDKIIMPLSEIYFMQAEAAILGFGGDANSLYQQGIQASFAQWGVSDNGYLASSMATLSGTKEEQLQQLGLQAWISYYYADYQGFAVARDFKLEGITDDVPDLPNLFSTNIPIGRKFPQRIKYGSNAYSLNGDNLLEAVARQGEDTPATELWFAKGEK
jgi:hypothetical protein